MRIPLGKILLVKEGTAPSKGEFDGLGGGSALHRQFLGGFALTDTQKPYRPGGHQSTAHPRAVYHRVLRKHAQAAGLGSASFGPHDLTATAATSALDRGAALGECSNGWGSERLDRAPLRPGTDLALKTAHLPRGLLSQWPTKKASIL
jgi:hypothetical protein